MIMQTERAILEKLALETCPPATYYELLDSLGECTDAELLEIINSALVQWSDLNPLEVITGLSRV